ncbi:MAG: type 2 isopentenyl-diphosphate Delta-isomerase [Nitrososphaerota archaeon]|nr:type 2 isopentenyl-diphosphate Delta-isomerase [Nitrososphaerota archaeon]
MEQRSRRRFGDKEIVERKEEHIDICLREDVEARRVSAGFDDVFLVHRAAPEINLSDIDLSTVFLAHKFSAPIFVEAITGGTENAAKINAAIAEAVEDLNIGMGVGSQRAALEKSELESTYRIAREKAPTAFLAANIGASQICMEGGARLAERAVEMIDADALVIHLNPLQESIQPEGEVNYSGILGKIDEISRALDVPVIVKETGAGISAEDARRLKGAGVSAIDVAGAGGTSWAAVEYYRAKKRQNHLREELGISLWDWGIPTVVSLVEVSQSVDLPLIASGGIRSGLDAAKSLAIGASLAGFALPILEAASKGSENVKRKIALVIHELRTVMFLSGASDLEKLRSVPIVITGRTAEWLRARGFQIETYARRGGLRE